VGTWQRYYRAVAGTAAMQRQVIERSLAAVAFDIPLLALFLLMSIRQDLLREPVDLRRLNSKRLRLGKRPLLEHLRISAPVWSPVAAVNPVQHDPERRGRRLHHVRGHLVRRQDTVYWRGPHWRGHMRLGSVRTRTVSLTLPG
jgi:hypothetical protein